MPALEALLDRFSACHTQPLGISVDSLHCHANWAQSLGGISFPLLADFHPKGAVASSYGAYLDGGGMTDRATVIIDAEGVVRHASSVTPSGKRDITELADLCEQVDSDFAQTLPKHGRAPGIGAGSMLFVKNSCGFSRAALLARSNLHLEHDLLIKNVTEDADALGELRQVAGNEQAPALVIGDELIQESGDIVATLARRCAPL